MTLDERLQNVAVVGAGGKMGSGIALLLAREMTLLHLKPENQAKKFVLHLVDISEKALEGVQQYLQAQSQKFAQKNSDLLLNTYAQLEKSLTPEELPQQFRNDMQSILHPTTRLEDVATAHMVFEAVFENVEVKTRLFSQLREICSPETFFFTNTSSIPIHVLNEKSALGGRLIGFHFYNPPAVQKLVEIIVPEGIHPHLPPLAEELGKRLKKILIPSSDVAGFIGNGHFMRDGLFGIEMAQSLQKEMSFIQAIYAVNRVSQDFLIRPMGIFQLMDYVGLDVFQSILNIMNPYFPDENLHSELIDEMVALGKKGGQNPDGSQKPGFFQYEGHRPVAIFDLARKCYVDWEEGDWRQQTDERLGPLPDNHHPWKQLVGDAERSAKLSAYFQQLKTMDTLGAQLARAYLKRSREIGEMLVNSGVARSAEDVNGVLMNGFYHLYGPINNYLE